MKRILGGSPYLGYVPDPPEPEECSPENYGEGACYFCQNHDYCKAECEKHEREVQDDRSDD